MRVSRSHRNAPATAPGFSFSETNCTGKLVGFLAGSTAAVGLTFGGELAEVVGAALRNHRAAFPP